MKILDIVRLPDGREGTIIEDFDGGAAFMVEIADDKGRTIDDPIVAAKDLTLVLSYNAA